MRYKYKLDSANLEVITESFNLFGICTSGNYAQTWIARLCNN